MTIVIASSALNEPAKVRLIEQSREHISFSFDDPEDNDLDFLKIMKDCGKPFSIEVDGELRFVEVMRIDDTIVELQTEHSTERYMSFKPN